jgi:chondroitin AC lyase
VEKGRWSDITDQKNISNEEVSMDVFKVWFDHGARPANASYQYIVVPAVSEKEFLKTSQNNRSIDILANTSEVQAVRNNKLNIAQIAFYRAGEVKLADHLTMRMDSQGMAMLKMQGDKIQELTVSDPSRKLSKVLVTLSGVYKATGTHSIVISNGEQSSTMILVDLPQGDFAGSSVTVKLE